MTRQDWRTVPSIFRLIEKELGTKIHLDTFATNENQLSGDYCVDAFSEEWTRPWFCQPPFEVLADAIERCVTSGAPGALLCLASANSRHFHRAWEFSELLIPTRRINYWHPDENPSRSFNRDSVIFLFGSVKIGTARAIGIHPHKEEIRRLHAEANGYELRP